MNFSDITSYSGQSAFSPNSEYIAIIKGIKLSIYESASMSFIHSFTLIDQVSKCQWSSDSSLIMCSQNKRAMIQIFSIKDVKWDCKINLGQCGLSGSWLSPDSCNIFTVCHFQIRLNIWNLSTKSVSTIMYPKFSNKGVVFSKCGNFSAVLKRNAGKDLVAVLDNELKIVSEFVLRTKETEDIWWSNDNFHIIAFDSAAWVVYSPSGELIYELADTSLILASSLNSPNGIYSVITSFTRKICVVHHLTWTILSTISFEKEINSKDTIIYTETETLENNQLSSSYIMVELPYKVPEIDSERGISIHKWSHNERYLSVKFGNFNVDASPNLVFIWDSVLLDWKSVLVQRNSVKSIEWCPTHCICAITTGNNRLYLWTEEGASLCDLPFGKIYLEREMNITKTVWSASGEFLAVKEKGNIVIAYPQLEEISG